MKKAIALLLALVMVFGLVACGEKAPAADDGKTTVTVIGHTDSVGSDAYNLQLSQARADSVRHALVREGVDPGRIQTVGLGKAHPVSDNNTPASQAMNRRVEVTVSHDGGNVSAR